MAHYLTNVVTKVDESHPKLGQPVAVSMLAVKARKLLLMVAPRGCGKSRISAFVGKEAPIQLLKDRLSVAGLQAYATQLSNFKGVLVVDDIAKSQTQYARIATITTLAELVYGHYIHSGLARSHFDIDDFYGSALINCQPVLLAELVRSTEWEASVQDKSFRYFHLHRPVRPNSAPPSLKLKWGIDFDSVEKHRIDLTRGRMLIKLTEIQWGVARQQEHLSDLLRACAALDRRKQVNELDYQVLTRLLAPLRIEELVMRKDSFESGRDLNANELAVLTEFATYGRFTLRQLSRDYKVSEATCYRIMERSLKDWRIVRKNPTIYAPTPELERKLKEVGICQRDTSESKKQR